MRRGEILWCDLEPRRGHEQGEVRPVIIVSDDAYNESHSPLIGIVPLTRAVEDSGLDSDSTALIEHARFIDRSRLRAKAAGKLTRSAQSRVDRNLARVFGLVR